MFEVSNKHPQNKTFYGASGIMRESVFKVRLTTKNSLSLLRGFTSCFVDRFVKIFFLLR